VTARAAGLSSSDTAQVTTYPLGTRGNVVCEDNPANADPDFCAGGVPIYSSPSTSGSPASRNDNGYEIFAVCKTTGSTVDGSPYGGRRSSTWIWKAGGHYIPYAFVNLSGRDIGDLTTCNH
jgi:hypothetical protein